MKDKYHPQLTDTLFVTYPEDFGFNEETYSDNKF